MIGLGTNNLTPLLVHAFHRTHGVVELLAGGNVGGAAPDVQTAEVAAQSRFAVREDLGAVDVDGEGEGGRVVRDANDAGAVLEKVFEDGEVGLG